MNRLLNYLYGAVVVPAAGESDRRTVADPEAALPRATDHATVVQAALYTVIDGDRGLTPEDLDAIYGAVWGLIGGFWAVVAEDVRASRVAIWAQTMARRVAVRTSAEN